eukprot:6365829-Amphidinium_carterae.1
MEATQAWVKGGADSGFLFGASSSALSLKTSPKCTELQHMKPRPLPQVGIDSMSKSSLLHLWDSRVGATVLWSSCTHDSLECRSTCLLYTSDAADDTPCVDL